MYPRKKLVYYGTATTKDQDKAPGHGGESSDSSIGATIG